MRCSTVKICHKFIVGVWIVLTCQGRWQMEKKDTGIANILEEIKSLRRKLYKARHEFKLANTLKYKRDLKLYMDDIRERIGWLLLDCGEYEKGLLMYQSLSWKTHGEEKYNGICRALIQMEYYGEAARLIERELKRFPESDFLLVGAGLLNKRLGHEYEALKCFEYALELDPDNKAALCDKALVLNDIGCYEEAAEILKALIETDSDDPEYLVEMGYSSLNQGYLEEAFKHLLDLLPKDTVVKVE